MVGYTVSCCVKSTSTAWDFPTLPPSSILSVPNHLSPPSNTMSRRRSSSDPDLTGDKAHVWALKHHRRGLIQRVLPADQRHAKRKSGYRINLAELQRMRLRALQIQLVDDVVNLCSNGYSHDNNREWEDHLEAYTKAIQDYTYMQQTATRHPRDRDPFLITTERWVDHYILDHFVQAPHLASQDVFSSEEWEPESVSSPIGGTRHETNQATAQRAFLDRLGLAIVGALFLVGPMWLMVLHNTMWTSLVSTSVLVFVFGFLAAVYLADKEKVLASTAAYAAVLVVFVGLGVERESA